MHVGLLIGGIPPDRNGGAEQQILQLAEELGRRGHTVTLFARTYVPRPKVENRKGYTLVRRPALNIRRAALLYDILQATFDLVRWRDRVEILLAYQTVANGLIGVLAGRVLDVPVAVSVRGNREYREFGPLPAFVYRRASAILVQSGLVKQDMLSHLRATGQFDLAESVEDRTTVFPNGVHLPGAAPAVGDRVVFVGRLVRDKGVSDLLLAANHVPEARLTIIGDGPDRRMLTAQAGMLKRPVRFTGWIGAHDVQKHLRLARLLALPSYRGDGLPNAALEAMSLGRPVIASAIAGIPEIVQHGRTGFLIKPGDVKELARAIGLLVRDERLAQELGHHARAVAENYSWERVIPTVEAVLRGLLAYPPEQHWAGETGIQREGARTSGK